MRFPPAAILSLSLLLCASGPALAGGYIGAGVGADSSLDGAISNHFRTDSGTNSGRIMIGERWGGLAIEASLFGTQLLGASQLTGPEVDYKTVSLGVDLKYHLGLFLGLEVFGKVGLNKTWLSASDSGPDLDYSGRGHEWGGGIQYVFGLPLAEVGVWLDYTVQNTKLRDGNRTSLDADIGMFNLGLTLGF